MTWETKRFGDVCEFVRGPFGGALKKNIFKEDGYAVYEQQHAIYNQFDSVRYFVDEDKFSEMGRFELFPDDLIMSCSGTMGKIAIVPSGIKQGIINQALLKLTPNKNLSPQFLKLWMESRNFQEQIELLSQGAAIKNMASVKILKEIMVPTPSEEEQKRIVTILDQAFADIEQARVKTEQNLKNARELLESYLQQVFSQRGEGWQTSKLNKVCKLINGRAYKKPEMLTEGKYPLLRVGNFFSNRSWYYSDLELNDDKYCNKGDLLYAWSASFGPRIWDGGKTIYHYHIWKVEVQKTLICRDFLYYWFHWDAERIKSEQGTGSTMIHVSMTSMNAREVSYPSINKQMELVRDLNKINLLVSDLEKVYSKKLNNIEELKKSILHKAFSGELTRTLEGETNKGAVA